VTRSRIVAAAVAVLVLLALAGLGRAARAQVSIVVTLGAGKMGSFRMTGRPTDAGRAVATRRVTRGRLVTKETLTSTRGTLVLESTQACVRATGTWKVVSGGGAYAGTRGSGTTRGRIGCTRPYKPTSIAHTGALVVPPPPLATAGTYRGWTTQDEEVSFDVTSGGRSLVNVLIGAYRYECVSQSGLRTSIGSDVDRTVAGPVRIADDSTFVVEISPPAVKLVGRFASTGATGTIVVQHDFTDYQGQPAKCAGEIPWTAATPPPPPKRAQAGKYCGITPQGEGVCLDVLAGGGELRNLTVGVPIVCGDVGFVIRITNEGPVAVRSNLSFQTSYVQQLGDDSSGSARVFLSGTFDQNGSTTGRTTLQQPTFTFQGTRYTCRNGGAAWTAKLQS
jgi:hypothetical protein